MSKRQDYFTSNYKTMKNTTLCLFVFLIFIGSSYAQTNIKCVSGNCVDGFGRGIFPKENSSYEGFWKENKRNGNGTYVDYWENSYTGAWTNDTLNGIVTIKWKDGRIYHGFYSKEKLNGYGVLRWSDGADYFGEFKNGQFDGIGFLKTSNNQTKCGIWNEGSLSQNVEMKKVTELIIKKYKTLNPDSMTYYTANTANKWTSKKFIVYFDFNSKLIDNKSLNVFDSINSYLKSNRTLLFDLTGHTCDKGSSLYNNKLGFARALACEKKLLALDIKKSNITIKSTGSESSLIENSNEVNRQKNRCVVILVLEKDIKKTE